MARRTILDFALDMSDISVIGSDDFGFLVEIERIGLCEERVSHCKWCAIIESLLCVGEAA